MSVLGSVLHDPCGKPLPQRVEVTCYLHSISEIADRSRAEIPNETHDCPGAKDGFPSQRSSAARRPEPLARSGGGNRP